MSIEMDEDTDYVHTHVINHETAYLALMDAVEQANGGEDPEELVDPLADVLYGCAPGMGLTAAEIDDADLQRMIEFEAENQE